MGKAFLACTAFLLFLLTLTEVSPMGLRGATLDDRFYFTPNLTQEISYFYVTNAGFNQDYELYVRMLEDSRVDLTPYVTLDHTIDRNVGSGATMPFTARISLPEKIDVPGDHEIRVGARETQSLGGGMMGVKTAAEARITITVLCPSDCAYVSFGAPNGNVNSSVNFMFTIRNLADHTLTARGKVEVISPEDLIMDVVRTEEKTVESTTSVSLPAPWNTTGYKPGEYKAHATLYWGRQNLTEFNTTFRIGNLNVKVNDYTKEFVKDAINKMQITVESGWNNPIPSMYAEVSVFDGFGNELTRFKTITASVDPWQQQTLLGYFDTTGLEYGTYPVRITLSYGSTTMVEGSITIKEGAQAETVAELPEEQQPSGFSLLSVTTLLIIVIILLVALIGVLLLFLKRHQQPAQQLPPAPPGT